MELDERSKRIAQIAAAAAANALTDLRFAMTEGLSQGLSKENIQSILRIAKDIQAQPQIHAQHMAEQILREPVKKQPAPDHSGHDHSGHGHSGHVHGPGCGCHS